MDKFADENGIYRPDKSSRHIWKSRKSWFRNICRLYCANHITATSCAARWELVDDEHGGVRCKHFKRKEGK